MTDIQTLSTRDVLRNYKQIAKQIQRTNQPIIIMNQKEPQVAIISIKTLREFEAQQKVKKSQSLLDLIGLIPKKSGLPKDLALKHNEYAWEK